jgi:hypothetical protein
MVNLVNLDNLTSTISYYIFLKEEIANNTRMASTKYSTTYYTVLEHLQQLGKNHLVYLEF